MQSHVFRVLIEEDRFEDGKPAFHASCPALKGCHTWGHSPEEALANIREAAELYVEDGLHLNMEGYHQMNTLLKPAIEKIWEKKPNR